MEAFLLLKHRDWCKERRGGQKGKLYDHIYVFQIFIPGNHFKYIERTFADSSFCLLTFGNLEKTFLSLSRIGHIDHMVYPLQTVVTLDIHFSQISPDS